MRHDRPDYAREIRSAFRSPRRLCERLGIDLRGAKHQAGEGVIIRCPVHEERTPSCSVTNGPDHTVRFRCFGCDATGDALDLIGIVTATPRTAFRELLVVAAELAGLGAIADEIRGGRPDPQRPPMQPLPPPAPAKPYLDEAVVRETWARSSLVSVDRDVSRYLVARRLDPELVAARGLAKVLDAPAPEWATYGRQSWLQTGHRMIFRVFDAWGVARGVRACRVVDGESPKRLPATGYRAGELVLANRAAWAMLRGDAPPEILIAEGETDWLTLATVKPDLPVLGIGSGAWTKDFADAIPADSDVYVYTDPDDAGERYAAKIFETLGEKCRTWRGVAA
jgi:hypothetical protein